MIDENESIIRLNTARAQQKILNLILDNLSDDNFNINLDLSNIDSQNLQNFWIYTAGFLGMQNYEKTEEYTEKEIEDMVSGKFTIKEFTKSEAYEFMKKLGIPVSKTEIPHNVSLFKIQNSTYYLEKNQDTKMYQFKLRTTDLKVENDEEKSYTPSNLFKGVRNAIVHQFPIQSEDKTEFLLPIKTDIIHVPNIWLRGYSELFASKCVKIDSNQIKEILQSNLNPSHNISNEKELNSALSLLKDFFGEEAKKTFFRINNYVGLRTQYYNDFYSKPLSTQIDLISQILSNNPVYIQNGFGTTNPMIIYNLQQIISNEINRRDSQTVQSMFLNYLNRPIIEVLSNFVESYYKGNIPKNATIYDFLDIAEKEFIDKKVINQLLNCDNDRINAVTNSLLAYIKAIRKHSKKALMFSESIYVKSAKELKQSLTNESAMMKLFNPDTLKNLPVEVAINTIALLAYNNLVTSGFYEEVLANTDFNYLSQAENEILAKINLTDFDCSSIKRANKKQPYTKSQTAFMLGVMRHALCHGDVIYKLPPKNKNGDRSFNDAVISFYASGKNNESQQIEVKGTVSALYKLFNSDNFLCKRDKLRSEKNAEFYSKNLDAAKQLLEQVQASIASEDYEDIPEGDIPGKE